jgi:LemA protein
MQNEWIVIAVLAVVAIYAIVVFNRLIRGRNLVREGWSGIDVQLRRRSDLVPNLVEIVKGYATHEHSLFEDIAAKRTSAIAADGVPQKAAAEHALQG